MDVNLVHIKSAAVQYVILLLSLTVHESAHAWTANRFGDPTAKSMGRISLNPLAHIDPIGTVLFPILQILYHIPLIGWAKPVPVNPLNLRNPRKDDLWISFAGPVSNFALGFLFLGMAFLLVQSGGIPLTAEPNVAQRMLSEFIKYGILINFMLGIFNLIPVPPLDGGGVLMGILPERSARSVEKIAPYGFIILMALLFLGILNYLFFAVWIIIQIFVTLLGLEPIFLLAG